MVDTDHVLKQGIAAARAGQRSEARQLLTRIIQADARNEQAWLWLAAVVDDPLQQRTCLQRVLDINPNNSRAQQGLAWINTRHPQTTIVNPSPNLHDRDHPAPAPPAPPVPREPEPAPAAQPTILSTPKHSLAARLAATRGEIAAPTQRPPSISPVAPVAPAVVAARTPQREPAHTDIGQRCPFCGAITAPRDRTCARCRTSLMVRADQAATISVSLFLLGIFWGVGSLIGILSNFFLLNREPGKVWGLVGWGLMFALAIGLLRRYRWAYIAAIVGCVVVFLLSFRVYAWPLMLPMFILIPRSYRDVFPTLCRLLPVLPERSYREHLEAGERYKQHDMWYMAIQEWERAAEMHPEEPSVHQRLGMAYIRLRQFELALKHLQEATRLKPGDPHIQEAIRTIETRTRSQQ